MRSIEGRDWLCTKSLEKSVRTKSGQVAREILREQGVKMGSCELPKSFTEARRGNFDEVCVALSE